MPDVANDRLRIAILAAGAAGMYCGSCIRDNALALALKRLGHDTVMIPLYTPVKTDTANASINKVFYGGVNTWLQHASRIFRKTPRALDWLMDRPWLLTLAGSYGAQTSPAQLGEFTLDILRGETGNTTKELKRLIKFLKTDIKPQVLSLPNLMFIGTAKMLREELGIPVIAELTGEDIFLNAMAEPHKSEAQRLIREKAKDVTKFVATSNYYADEMARYMNVARERIEVVYPGIPAEYLTPSPARANNAISPNTPSRVGEGGGEGKTVGYLARICPEKGLDQLVEALLLLRQKPGFEQTKLHAAGYLGKAHAAWYDQLKQRIDASPLKIDYTYLGEVDGPGKLALIDSVDLFCVPTTYPEPKGLYVLESLARGTPVVLPHHGAFPELIEATNGGLTAPPMNPQALADALAQLLADPTRRQQMGQSGHTAVAANFLDTHMAQEMLKIYRAAISSSQPSSP